MFCCHAPLRLIAVLVWLVCALMPGRSQAMCAVPLAAAGQQAVDGGLACVMALATDGQSSKVTLRFGQVDYMRGLLIPVPPSVTLDQLMIPDAAAINALEAYTRPGLVRLKDGDPCGADPSPQPLPPGPMMQHDRLVAGELPLQPRYRAELLRSGDISAASDLRFQLAQLGFEPPRTRLEALAQQAKQGQDFVVLVPQRQATSTSMYAPPVSYAFGRLTGPIWHDPLPRGDASMTLLVVTPADPLLPRWPARVSLPSGTEVPELVDKNLQGWWREISGHQQAQMKGAAASIVEYAARLDQPCPSCRHERPGFQTFSALGAEWTAQGAANLFVDDTAEQEPELEGMLTRFSIPAALLTDKAPPLYLDAQSPVQPIRSHVATTERFDGPVDGCEAGLRYAEILNQRYKATAQNLHRLTGMPLDSIKARMEMAGQVIISPQATQALSPRWYKRLWE